MSLNAFVTLVTTDSYVPGALVTVHSVLEAEGATPAAAFETVCLVTPATVSVESIKALRRNFSLVVGVEEIRSGNSEELRLLGREDLAATLTKLHLFRLIQFRKVIFLDADTLCLQPLSHLFSTEAAFSAAPDSGWPDCFNSGMFVASPSVETFEGLVEMSRERGSWDGGDQGLLNDFFPDWNRLSFTYNVTPTAYYTYAPAYRRHGSGIKLVHFIGSHKPWHEPGPSRSHIASSEHPGSNDYASLVNRWFTVYQRYFGSGEAKSTFSFPTLQATWDSPGNMTPYTPPSLEELKKTFQGAGNGKKYSSGTVSNHIGGNAIEGHYVSMPLQAGRPDLSGNLVFGRPGLPASAMDISLLQAADSPPHLRPSMSPPLPAHHTTSAPSHNEAAPRPWSPQLVSWDPARSEPPKNDRPQMEHGFSQQYDNIWDAPISAPASKAFFTAPASYGAIPTITHQNYDQVTRQHSPDARAVKPVFPWENNTQGQGQYSASRVFPQELPRRQPSPQQTNSSASTAAQGQAKSSTAAGFNSAGLTSKYSNAWDDVAAIKRYANGLQGKGGNKKQQHGQNGSSQHSRSSSTSVSSGASSSSNSSSQTIKGRQVGTSYTDGGRNSNNPSSPRKEEYETGGEASSRDGDDEDEDDEDENKDDSGYARKSVMFKMGGSSSNRPSTRQAAAPAHAPSALKQRSPPSAGTSSRGASGMASRGLPPPPFARPGPIRNDSYQNMANLTANVAAAGPIGAGPMSPSLSQSGSSSYNMPARGPGSRFASQRTSSSETITSVSSGLPDPSNGSYQSQRVSRVFDPSTATDVIRKEGLDALNRFVKNMGSKSPDGRNGSGNGSSTGGGSGNASSSSVGSASGRTPQQQQFARKY